jgi:hypothetical protein
MWRPLSWILGSTPDASGLPTDAPQCAPPNTETLRKSARAASSAASSGTVTSVVTQDVTADVTKPGITEASTAPVTTVVTAEVTEAPPTIDPSWIISKWADPKPFPAGNVPLPRPYAAAFPDRGGARCGTVCSAAAAAGMRRPVGSADVHRACDLPSALSGAWMAAEALDGEKRCRRLPREVIAATIPTC